MLLRQRLRLRWPRRRQNKVRRLPRQLPSPLAPRSRMRKRSRAATSLRSLKRKRRAAINPKRAKRRRRMPARNLLTVPQRKPLLMESPSLTASLLLMVKPPLTVLLRSPQLTVRRPRSKLTLGLPSLPLMEQMPQQRSE